MSEIAAVYEAQKRWGKSVRVEFELCRAYIDGKRALCTAHHGPNCPGGFPAAQVGHVHGLAGVIVVNSVKGSGATFDECFAEADLHAHETYKRCCVDSGHKDGCEVRRALKVRYQELRSANPGSAAWLERKAAATVEAT